MIHEDAVDRESALQPRTARTGGTGIVLYSEIAPAQAGPAPAGPGAPSGVVWLEAGQSGVRGLEGSLSRRIFGPPGTHIKRLLHGSNNLELGMPFHDE
jgi:hypothetical protein